MDQNLKEKIVSLAKQIVVQSCSTNEKLAQISAMLKEQVFHYDWVGFYILDHQTNTLKLGPYKGAPTEHTSIPIGKGVCGQVAQNKQAIVVQDVSAIDNYLSCSIDVQSEIVVPILDNNGKFIAEIDIDSHSPAPFCDIDQQLLEAIANLLAPLFI